MTPVTHPWATRARRVLVVDDDEQARLEFAVTLRDAGYDVTEATSVVQAMRLLLSTTPDAVVLDLVLPDGHGIDVGRAMRAIVTTQRTCVVAVTANAGSIELLDPASFGAETILLKPVTVEALLRAVGGCFEERLHSTVDLEDEAGPDVTPPEPA